MTDRDGASIGETVRLEDLAKAYDAIGAVNGVSLQVGAGEFLSLLGPSGSGKTTLLMMVAGFERPSAGRILIGNQEVTQVPPNRRGIGMVFQSYALFPHMTVAQNVAFPLKMRRLPRQEVARRVQSALALVRLEREAERVPRQLSGGQQQRVAVARALVFEPPVLLMDEPLGALDRKLREQMQIEIRSIQQRIGVTVIYVTHDQEEALTLSDRVAVINEGRLVQIGTPVELYQAPATPFVADFIGKMNFLDGEYVGRDNGDYRVRLARGATLRVPQTWDAAAPLHDRAPVRIAIRPERLRLVPAGEGGPEALAGRVDAAIFVGSFRLFLVAVPGREGRPLHIQLPAAAGPVIEQGDSVDVVLEREAMRLFPAMAA